MSWPSKLRALFGKEKLDAEMTEEMRAHLELQAEQNIARGMSTDEARYAAQRQFGGVEQIKEHTRDQRGVLWLEHLAQDLRYAARMLRKSPGFTIVAVLTLALGIGLNTAIFTLLENLVFQPPRVHQPATVISVFSKDKRQPANTQATTRATTPYVDYTFYRDHQNVFTGLASAMLVPVTMGIAADPAATTRGVPEEREIFVQLVSGNYFEVLGGRTTLGRAFLPEEDRVPGANPVAVLSFRFWQRHFAGDASVVGKTFKLNGGDYTVIGVAAADFGGNRLMEPAAWVPMMMAAQIAPGTHLNARAGTYVDMVGRLKPGVTLDQAQAQMDVVAQQNLAQRPESKVIGVRLARLATGTELSMWALAPTLFGMLLLVVVANVANLSLARSVSRYREIGVRLTLGAGRGRLIRQLLTESALLGLLGGAVGLGLAGAATRLLLAFMQRQAGQSSLFDLAANFDLRPDLTVFGFAAVVSLIAGIMVGLAPALQATKRDLASALKDEGSVFGRHISRSRLRNLLVIVQVAFCLVLLVGAGLLVRGLEKAQSIDPGFDFKRLLVVQPDLRSHGYDALRRAEFYRSFAERARRLPGIRTVGFATNVPLQGAATGPASASATEPGRQVGFNFVSADFFPTVGIPILAGRNFRDDEARQSKPVVIVNEALARLLWPGENPVGKQLHDFFDDPVEVVGLVRNARNARLWQENAPFMYFLDRPSAREDWGSQKNNLAILIRTEGDPRAAIVNVRDTMRGLDSAVWPVIRTLESDLELQLVPSRVGAWLSAMLGLLALAVTAIGLYGVIAYATNQRTREIGVRMALGARPADVLRLVLGQGWRLLAIGFVLGLGGAVALGRVLANFLYGLSPLDPIAFGGVTLFLALIAMLACWLPARRATKVDPMVALRCE
jgi:macrolide transport system ATP-binding/permease protein